jgi:oxygen-dependent protoporphyrinogen oxidase
MQDKKIAVLGAGISGLTSAYYLKKSGFDVTVFEKNSRAGGLIETEKKDNYILDKGIATGIESTSLISDLVNELKLEASILYAGEKANLKQAYISGSLFDLSMNPNNLLKFPLFSFNTKFRFFLEPFLPRTSEKKDMSVADFIKRRLGTQFLDYIIEPFASEVYAGDPKKLSVKAAYPKLFKLEQDYGSIIKGFKKAPLLQKKREELEGSGKLFGFKGGMEELTLALASKFSFKINYLHDILKIEKKENGYNIIINKKGDIRQQYFDIVISALPAYVLEETLKEFDQNFSSVLSKIEYAPLIQVYVAFLKQDIEQTARGYSVLIPAIENKEILNITLISEILQGRCPDDRHLFSVMMGGCRNVDLGSTDSKDLQRMAIETISEIYKAKDKPIFVSFKSWKRAVPQYNTGYFNLTEKIKKFESENLGFFVSSNFAGGVAIGDSILNSYKIAERVSRSVGNL